jgi:hypothetical protein
MPNVAGVVVLQTQSMTKLVHDLKKAARCPKVERLHPAMKPCGSKTGIAAGTNFDIIGLIANSEIIDNFRAKRV